MTPEDFDRILRETLEDRRLSRSEKRALKDLLAGTDLDAHARSLLRNRAFEIAQHEVADPQSHAVIDWLDDVSKCLLPDGDNADGAESDALFSPGDDCPRRIAFMFARAKQQVDVCVFTITDNIIAEAILEAHRRGVAVRIITDGEKSFDSGSDVERLAGAGVPVRVDRSEYHMHHKFAVFDQQALLTGSYNWTRGAALNNEENFIVTNDLALVRKFIDAFETLWSRLA